MRRELKSVAATLCLGLASACAPPPTEPPRIPEPTSALRPEALRGPVPEDARITDYQLDARLDTKTHRIEATARVTWRNTTTRTVETLPFHLYMNGFRAEDTEWMKSSRGRHRRNFQVKDGAWGYIDVHSVTLESSTTFTDDAVDVDPLEDVALAWSEDPDPSTMTAHLPRPVGPGEALTVQLEFTTQLPRVIARTGYHGDFYAVGQWFPKLGVLEEEAGWQAHTFTVHDEFYANFGNYEVQLDVPEEMLVGATGIRVAEEIEDGRKKLSYVAEMVHDFVWMGDPNFRILDSEYRGVRIRQLIQPDRVADGEAHLAAQLAAFESYEKRFGPYPWSTLTIVHPPSGASGAMGMEYPTLFTTSNRAEIPSWIRSHILDERMSGLTTTVHEFGHQYFQGMLASREHEEPWFDEGINTMSNVLAAIDAYGENPWLVRILSHEMRARDLLRAAIRGRAFYQPIDQPARAFKRELRNYGSTTYSRTAAVMLTLRNLAGHEAFDTSFRDFSTAWRFRHPRGEDLEQALIQGLGGRVQLSGPDEPPVFLDVAHYLDQALRTHHQLSYAVIGATNRRRAREAGWHRQGQDLEGGDPPANLGKAVSGLDDDDDVEGVVTVRRIGAFELPVELLVEFADGSVERRFWDARNPAEVFTWPGRRIRRATLDPEHHLLLEWKRLDNTVYAPGFDEPRGPDVALANLLEGLGLALMGITGP